MKLTFKTTRSVVGTIMACSHLKVVGWFAITPVFAGTAFERMYLN